MAFGGGEVARRRCSGAGAGRAHGLLGGGAPGQAHRLHHAHLSALRGRLLSIRDHRSGPGRSDRGPADPGPMSVSGEVGLVRLAIPTISDCRPLLRCSPNPCLNLGRCVQTGFASFGCECERNYTGRFCHICGFCHVPMDKFRMIYSAKLPHSCEEHVVSFANKKNAPERVLIDLDGGGPLRPFTVECRRRGPKSAKCQFGEKE